MIDHFIGFFEETVEETLDEIVPVANSVRWAQEHGAELHLLNSDHRLTDKIAEINRLFDGFLQDVAAG